MSQQSALDPRDGPIHDWFGLTYASYLVLPRSVLQSMPLEWQERFVGLLSELGEVARVAGVETPKYRIHAVDNGGRCVPDPFREYRRSPNWLTPAEFAGERT